jgi:hypothetical protein
MKRTLIAVLAGVLLTLLFFALAGLLGGACHCITPTTLFFPYGAFILGRFSAESISLLAMAIQFPLYALVLAKVKGRERRIVILLLLLAFHVAAALVSLKLYDR